MLWQIQTVINIELIFSLLILGHLEEILELLLVVPHLFIFIKQSSPMRNKPLIPNAFSLHRGVK